MVGFSVPSPYNQLHSLFSDAMCSGEVITIVYLCWLLILTPGPEHTTAEGSAAQPSFCTLPLFHVPMEPNNDPATLGYVSNDGHFFACRNPVVMQQAFHV
jgi:hypothetical protein